LPKDLFSETNAKDRLLEAIEIALDEGEGLNTDELVQLIGDQVWDVVKELDPEEIGIAMEDEEG
jgi:hypothetical protein